ncbi:MAG: hypothetical protein A2283_11300 [Lentisphaerae bacterium RIFOXYA12_FULL_48_11]|nr:MAG: hypothetical protein A2283_11300 [Lentisphaerae bacterium RIFOXYA12_FULL_48_11]
MLAGVVAGAIIGGGWGVLAALPFVFVGTLVVVPSITSILAQPFSSLLYPSKHLDHTMPMYSIPQSKRAKGLYEEAIAGYEKIAVEYPDEVKPYIEMVTIAIMDLRNVEQAKSFLGRGMVLLKDESARKVLQESYNAVITRLEVKPEWLREQESRTIVPEKVERTLPVEEPDGLTKRRYHPGGYMQDNKDGFVDDRKTIARKH